MANMPLSPPTGLTSDDTVFAAPGRWLNGSLARFYENGWQIKGGWERLTLETLGGVCRAVFGWSDPNEELNIAFGTHLTLEAWRGGALYNITPAGFIAGQIDGTGGRGHGTGAFGVGTFGTPSTVDYFPLTWSLSAFGGWLIANPRNQGIYVWNTTAPGVAALIPTAPVRVTYALTVPQRQVIAFGCNEEVSGVFNPLCIRWSDIEDYTDWASLPSNNAGEYVLESGGRIVCARAVGDYLLVWTSVSVFLGTFLGDPGQTWKFERIGANCGAISPGAPVIKSQHAAWISPDRVHWQLTLGGEPTPMDCPVRAMFADHITAGQDDKIVGASTATFSELTWFWPDDRDGFETSRGLTVGPGGWSRDLLKRSAYVDAGPHPFPIGVAPSGQVYWHEKGQSADGGVLSGFIESTGIYLDEGDGGVMVNGVWPDFRGQVGVMRLSLLMREFPQAPERVHGPWNLTPGMSKKSFRCSGRIARVRFDFASAPASARAGKLEFDVQPIGGR